MQKSSSNIAPIIVITVIVIMLIVLASTIIKDRKTWKKHEKHIHALKRKHEKSINP